LVILHVIIFKRTYIGENYIMKKLKISLIVISIFFLSRSILVYAHENEKPHSEGIELTITGQLISITCLVKDGLKGEEHKDCFKQCLDRGLPIGILTKEGMIYQISGTGHDALTRIYKIIEKYGEEMVIAKGNVFKRNNINLFVINKIKKQ